MSNNEELKPFKYIIKVIKSLAPDECNNCCFTDKLYLREPLVYAKSKEEVERMILEKYPQLFPTDKVFKRESKDTAQFFYALVYPLYDYEIEQIEEGEWTCDGCGHVHENAYISRPQFYNSFSKTLKFCRADNDDYCLKLYKKTHLAESEIHDDMNYVRADSPTYIYKITQKNSGKCYIGKTRNEPFFRWWNHLSHSQSPFGKVLRESKLSDWTFEVLEILDWNVPDHEVFKVESTYMIQFNSLNNGFNKLISNKAAINLDLEV